MKVKFIMLSAILAFTMTSISAQGFKFGIEAGYDNVQFKGWEIEYNYDDWEHYYTGGQNSLNGFHIGPTFNFEFQRNGGFGLNTGLFWLHASGKDLIYNDCIEAEYDRWKYEESKDEEYGCKWRSIMKYDAIEIPIRLNYTYKIDQDWEIFCFAGPKIEYGISLKNKDIYKDCKGREYKGSEYTEEVRTLNYYNGEKKREIDGEDITRKDYNKDAKAWYKRFNIDLGLGFGITYKKVYASLNYDWGLLNRGEKYFNVNNEERDHKYKLYNKNLAVSVGVKF